MLMSSARQSDRQTDSQTDTDSQTENYGDGFVVYASGSPSP